MRLDRGWSLRELATRSGMDATAISQIERGQRQPLAKTWKKLMDALQAPGDDRERAAFVAGWHEGAEWERRNAMDEPIIGGNHAQRAYERWRGERDG